MVAGEVKDLAKQTADATGSIDAQVAAIRDDSTATATALDSISHVITEISEHQAGITTAVETQTTATLEMTRRVQDTGQTAVALTTTISELAAAASRSTTGTREVSAAIQALADIAAHLNQLTATYDTGRSSATGTAHSPHRQPGPQTATATPSRPLRANEPATVPAGSPSEPIELF